MQKTKVTNFWAQDLTEITALKLTYHIIRQQLVVLGRSLKYSNTRNSCLLLDLLELEVLVKLKYSKTIELLSFNPNEFSKYSNSKTLLTSMRQIQNVANFIKNCLQNSNAVRPNTTKYFRGAHFQKNDIRLIQAG